MPVETAATAGFCEGIRRAVGMVEESVARGERPQILGELLHNPQMMERFCRMGVTVIRSVDEAQSGRVTIVRSHGVPPSVYDGLERAGAIILDATCPSVRRIHRIVRRAGEQGRVTVILGEPGHAEIEGITGHCTGEYHVLASVCELKRFLQSEKNSVNKSYIFVAQTTFKLEEWQKGSELIKKECTNFSLFGTICNATMLRQNEAEEMSRRCEAMVVVGGRKSANTARLFEICSKNCAVFQVETARELRGFDFNGAKLIGVTAGASTPAFIIKEVQETMSEILGAQDEMSFEEMLEQSFKTIYSKERVTGLVTSVSPNEIAVDIGTKHAGYIPLNEYTDDPNAKLEELVQVGDSLELIVLRVNDVEGTAMLSKKRLDAIAGFEKVMEAEASGEILEGTVVDIVKGGVIALSNGVRVFIPASQATLSRNQPLEPLLRQQVSFKILETNRQRRRAVGSIRTVLKDQRKVLEEKFWQEVEVGKVYNGTVKSMTSYGVFVDLGGVDGMVHISELSWNRIKDPSEVVSVGDQMEVTVKDIDAENKKISLGYKKNEDNPWELLQKQYQPGDVARVKVVSMTPFGAFAQVIPGVDGLIHISQISNVRIGKPSDVLSVGQELDAKITDINLEKKRVSLSVRELLSEEPEYSEDDVGYEDTVEQQDFEPEDEQSGDDE